MPDFLFGVNSILKHNCFSIEVLWTRTLRVYSKPYQHILHPAVFLFSR